MGPNEKRDLNARPTLFSHSHFTHALPCIGFEHFFFSSQNAFAIFFDDQLFQNQKRRVSLSFSFATNLFFLIMSLLEKKERLFIARFSVK